MIFWFSSNPLATKKITKKATKKITKKATKKITKKATKSAKSTKKSSKKKIKSEPEDSGIIIVDDDLTVDRESEMEERRAYLEEARSQEASSD